MDNLYAKKIAMVSASRCYYHADNQRYFIFALYPPTLHYSSNTISRYQGGWYTGKLMTLIAIDDTGNFYYRYPDGSIRYYHHQRQTETTVALSEKQFLSGITPNDSDAHEKIL